MKRPLAPNLPRAAIVFAAALFVAGCATGGGSAQRYAPPKLGTTWTNARMDTGSYGSGAARVTWRRGERDWQGARLASFETPQSVTLLNADGQWLRQISPAGRPAVSFDPPIGYRWPLEVGRTWTQRYQATNHLAQQTVAFDTTWTVEAAETIEVPAGSFATLRIRFTDSLGSQDVYWYSPKLGLTVKQNLRRSERHPAGPGTREVVLESLKPAK